MHERIHYQCIRPLKTRQPDTQPNTKEKRNYTNTDYHNP
jgi:hypothetical protein